MEYMVSNIHATVDDELADELKEVKDANGWTWREFLENSAEVFGMFDEEVVAGESWIQSNRVEDRKEECGQMVYNMVNEE